MTYRHGQKIIKDKPGFARVALWTVIVCSIASLTIYLVLIKIDTDLRQEIKVQEQITDKRMAPKEATYEAN